MDVTALFSHESKNDPEVNAGIIVLENPSGNMPFNDTNLYLVHQHGEIVWKAEKPIPYTSFPRPTQRRRSKLLFQPTPSRTCL